MHKHEMERFVVPTRGKIGIRRTEMETKHRSDPSDDTVHTGHRTFRQLTGESVQ
ncbi:hypothetical protein MY1884_007396 [Beauveria asiatica]